MNIVDIKTLASVIEHGGITRAAKALNRVPSGITTRILQLEEELGVQLFVREKGRLLVTAQGRELYRYAKKIMELLAEAKMRVKEAKPGGRLRVGAMESTIAARLPEPLAKLHAQYPDVRLELTAGTSRNLFELLLENRLDAVFIADPPADERMEHLPVFTEELVLVAPGDYGPMPDPRTMAEATVLAFKDGCSYRNRLMRWLGTYGLEPARIAELTSYHAIMAGAAAGMGIGFVPASVLELFPQKSALSVQRIAHPLAAAETVLAWRKGMKSANVSALLQYL